MTPKLNIVGTSVDRKSCFCSYSIKIKNYKREKLMSILYTVMFILLVRSVYHKHILYVK